MGLVAKMPRFLKVAGWLPSCIVYCQTPVIDSYVRLFRTEDGMRPSRDFRWLTVGLLFASLLYGAGLVLAARAPDTVYACVNDKTGASRAVSADGQCASGEALFTGRK